MDESTVSSNSGELESGGNPKEAVIGAPVYREKPEETEDREEVARAMDMAGIRQLVVNLKLAGAKDDERLKESMIRSLKRYGSKARPVMEEEYRKETNEKAKSALREALEEVW